MQNDRPRILVYGWYHQFNLGDDLFIEAFRALWPEADFTFTCLITKKQIRDADFLVFGGGSFLDNPIRCELGTRNVIAETPILYIGVGLETIIHPDHLSLLERARLVAVRGKTNKIQNPIVIPDLVYALSYRRTKLSNSDKPSILFVPNVSVLPVRSDPQWKHAAWGYFKSECSQFLDEQISVGRKVRIFNMCRSTKLDDMWASTEIVSQMENRERDLLLSDSPDSTETAVEFFSQFSVVVTQRFHGKVLSDMAGTPCITVAHHDKLMSGTSLSYYGVTKKNLHQSIETALRFTTRPSVPGIDDFTVLRDAVKNIILR